MNERAEDLILLAALGELTPDERSELDALAAADPAVAAELAAEMDTAAALLSATPIEAPGSLRASVLDAIADVAQENPEPLPEPVPAPVVSLSAARERRTRRLAPILSAAAAVLLLVGGAFVLTGRGDSSGDEVAIILEASDAVERQFVGMSDGSLTLVHSPSHSAIILDGDGMPLLTDAQTYVLWLIHDGEATPAAEFRPDTSGHVSARFDGVDPSDAVLGITAEAVGNVTTPTEPILATA